MFSRNCRSFLGINMLLLLVGTSCGKLVDEMRFFMIWVVVAAWGSVGVNGKDGLDSVIYIVYNPSAGSFQDTSDAFYSPKQSEVDLRESGRRSIASNLNLIFPDEYRRQTIKVWRKTAKSFT